MFKRLRAFGRNMADPRVAAASFLLVCAFVFLTINSTILARGAARWAQSAWDQLAYGTVAAAVPWIIALIPILTVVAIKQRRIGWLAAVLVMGTAFIAYNILGSGGAISTSRSDSISERKFDAGRQKDAAKRRATIQAQIDAIDAKTRPAASLAPLLEKEKASRWWDRTDGCQDGSRAPSFCANYRRLEAEHGAAQRLEKLTTDLAAIDDKASVAGWAAEIVDPTAQFWSTWTGLSEPTVQALIPLTTPIILELGSWILLGVAFMLFGLTHEAFLFGSAATTHTGRAVAAAMAPSPARGSAVAAISLPKGVSRAEFLATYLFSQWSRPVPSGGMPEARWYEHYLEICNQSNDTPLPLEAFREVAKRYVPAVTFTAGQFFYERVLPNVPRAA